MGYLSPLKLPFGGHSKAWSSTTATTATTAAAITTTAQEPQDAGTYANSDDNDNDSDNDAGLERAVAAYLEEVGGSALASKIAEELNVQPVSRIIHFSLSNNSSSNSNNSDNAKRWCLVVSNDVPPGERIWLVRGSVDAARVAAAVYAALVCARRHTLGLVVAATLQRRVVQNRALDFDFVEALRAYPAVFVVDDTTFAVSLKAGVIPSQQQQQQQQQQPLSIGAISSQCCPLYAMAGLVYELAPMDPGSQQQQDFTEAFLREKLGAHSAEDVLYVIEKKDGTATTVVAIFADKMRTQAALAAGVAAGAAELGLAVVPIHLSRSSAARALAQRVCAQVEPPTIVAARDAAAGTVTLACPTQEAEVYYTTDGSVPVPGLHGSLYSGPITLADPATVLTAVAAKPFMADSTPLRKTLRTPGTPPADADTDPLVINYNDIIFQPAFASVKKKQ